jgi:hypothetical protein
MTKKEKQKKAKYTQLLIGIGAAFLVMVVYLAVQGRNIAPDNQESTAQAGVPSIPATSMDDLLEDRQLLNSDFFTGRVRKVYQWAHETPAAFDALYCYCRCKENPRFKHRTLLTCYVDDHAANCGICLDEGEMAWNLTKDGKSPAEIRKIVDKKYAKKLSH